MLRILPLIFLFIFIVTGPANAAADCAYRAADPSIRTIPTQLKRGVNLSQWWQDGRRRPLEPNDLRAIRTLGFDFVRLPVSPSWPEIDDEGERNERLGDLRCDIVSILQAGLTVIVDVHAPRAFTHELIASPPGEARVRLETLWRRLQPVIGDLPPDRVLIGLYNEPGIANKVWWPLQGKLIEDLRASFPANTFVASAGSDGEPWKLIKMKPYADKNIIYDFHFYQPMFFTHHGAEWLPSYRPDQKTGPVAYPVVEGTNVDEDDTKMRAYVAQDWNRAKLSAYIQAVANWAKNHHVTVACLEFGVYRPHVDDESRVNWLRDMREILESAGIPWALWEYRGGFGLIDPRGSLDEGMAKALGLSHNSSP